jgi:hypothetical protein
MDGFLKYEMYYLKDFKDYESRKPFKYNYEQKNLLENRPRISRSPDIPNYFNVYLTGSNSNIGRNFLVRGWDQDNQLFI